MTNLEIKSEIRNFINSNFPAYKNCTIDIEDFIVILNKGKVEQTFSIFNRNSRIDIWGDGFTTRMGNFLESLSRDIKIGSILEK